MNDESERAVRLAAALGGSAAALQPTSKVLGDLQAMCSFVRGESASLDFDDEPGSFRAAQGRMAARDDK